MNSSADRGAEPSRSVKTAPYGAWKSPITSELLVGSSIVLSEARFDDGNVYWIEGRPQEDGRCVIVCSGPDGKHSDLTPPSFNVRTRVHEYGGASWLVSKGALYFSNLADGRLYRQEPGDPEPQPLTPEPPSRDRQWRFADGSIDGLRNRWIGVREDHTGGSEPANTIVAVPLAGPGDAPGRILASGHDFFCSPRLSPDGKRLLWLAWDHPNMPWNGTMLFLAEIDGDGDIGEPRLIAGGTDESIFQPEWSPDGSWIAFVSDRSGWWNLYGFALDTEAIRPLAPMSAEFGVPQWSLAASTYAFSAPDQILCTYSKGGVGHLARLNATTGGINPIKMPFTDFAFLRASGDRAVFRGGAPDHPASIVALDIGSGDWSVIKRASDLLDGPDVRITNWLTRPESVEFPTTGERTAFGLYYPPHNPDYRGPDDEAPPLLVKCHGGPTSSASTTLSLATQYWTSRGIAVLDVNYGGSAGFGRAYRERLDGNWGVVDVDDCVNGAKFLAEQGRVDGKRCVISGASAGGYTTLAALAFRDFFQGGASYYGVSDAAALTRETHKFESHYLDWLIGPYPKEAARYRERSPLFHADRLSKPVIFFQGEDDVVVPPSQAEAMIEALRRRGNPVGYFLFTGEQHGFRQAANIRRCLDAELYFYAVEVFRVGLAF